MDNSDYSDSSSREDTDLRGMEPATAEEYVYNFIKSLKETQRQKEKRLEELAIWEDRIKMARGAGRSDLVQAAEEKVRDFREQIIRLNDEEADLKLKVNRLTENLKILQHGFQRTIDTEVLLADMEMLLGEKDTMEEKFRDQEAQRELEELKKKLQEEQ